MNPAVILSFFVGILTRYVDDFYDLRKKIHKKYPEKLVLLMGVIYGTFIAITIYLVPVISELALAVIIALLVSRKIDALGHILGVIFFVAGFLIIFIMSPVSIDLSLLVIFLTAGLLDELVSDYSEKHRGLVYRFFESRPLMEITVFLISFVTGKWEMWITLLLYDIGAGYFPLKVKKL